MSLRNRLSRKAQALLCIAMMLIAFATPTAFASDDKGDNGSVIEMVLGWIGNLVNGNTNSTDGDDDEFMGSIVPGG